MRLKLVLVFALVFPIGFLGYDYVHRDARADAAGGSAVVDAGSSEAITPAPGAGSGEAPVVAAPAPAATDGSGSATPAPAPTKPSDQLHDPLENPGATIDDVKAAKKYGWGAAVFAVLLVLLKLASKAKSIGVLSWLGKGRVATVVAGATVVLAGCYDVLMQGGSWVATAIAGAIAFAAFYDSTTKPPAAAPKV